MEKADKVYNVTGDLTMHGKTESVTFPASVTADANDIMANYHWGVLQVNIGLRGEDEAGRRIPVQTTAS